jgi:Asp-tRNA(Asn)/Glu-tRNA(Gln) amidotransferase A subunit family amidase
MLREAAGAVRSGQVSSRELLERSLARIASDPLGVNAVGRLRADEALQEAAAIDAQIATGADPGPLAGIPCLIKDIEDLSGMTTTHGSLLFEHDPSATEDGVISARLRAAGAIPIGKANTSEFATEGFTGNEVFGITLNPWAPSWSPSGSSGGSGAAIAAGFVPIATATDTGGSVRAPAAFCGLVGLKPTNGVIGRDLRLPWPTLTTSGPLGVSVDDVRLLLDVTAGPVAGDPSALPSGRPGIRGMPQLVLAAPRFTPGEPLPAPVSRALDEALARVSDALSVSVQSIEPEAIFRSGNPDRDWFVIAGPELVEWLGRETVEKRRREFCPTTWTFLEEGLSTSFGDYLAANSRRFSYVRELDELLKEDVVIATPTIAAEGWLPEGPRPGFDEASPSSEVYNCIAQNMTGHPAISVPAGILPNGVPFGLQFTGPRFRDDLLLNLASRWEQAHSWPLSAPGFEPFWN